MSSPTPICPICNYSLVGLTPDQHHHITCPECGTLLEPTPLPNFDEQSLHRVFRQRFLIPIAALSVTALILSFAPFPIGSILLVLYIMASFVFIPILWIISSLKYRQRYKAIPKEVSNRILRISLLYTLPIAGLYIVLFWRYSTIALAA